MVSKKTRKLIIGIVVLSGFIGATVFWSQTHGATTPIWRQVTTFSGGLVPITNTPAFVVNVTQSRLTWSYVANGTNPPFLNIYLYGQNNSQRPLTALVCLGHSVDLQYHCPEGNPPQETVTDSLNQYVPNTLYLQILSNVASWNIVIEAYF